jgi:hypothetical protein
MRSTLAFVFEVAALPITWLGYALIWLGGLSVLIGLVSILFVPFGTAMLIWAGGLTIVAAGGAAVFGVGAVSSRIAYGDLYSRRVRKRTSRR